MPSHVRTTRFERPELVEVPDSALLSCPEGLPGFETLRAFALIDDPRYRPLGWLQSLDDPTVRFVVIPRAAVVAGGPPRLAAADRAALGLDADLDADAEIDWLLIVTIGADPRDATANLRVPVAVCRPTGRGKQVILADEQLPLRHPLFASAARPKAGVLACSS